MEAVEGVSCGEFDGGGWGWWFFSGERLCGPLFFCSRSRDRSFLLRVADFRGNDVGVASVGGEFGWRCPVFSGIVARVVACTRSVHVFQRSSVHLSPLEGCWGPLGGGAGNQEGYFSGDGQL